MKRSEAKKLREIIEIAVQSLDDETAEEAAVLFPSIDEETTEVTKGKRYFHKGKLIKAKKDIKDKGNKHFDDNDFWEEINSRNNHNSSHKNN